MRSIDLDPELKVSLDTDWFYRRPSAGFMNLLEGPLARLEYGFVGEIYEFLVRRPVLGAANLLRRVDSLVVDPAAGGVGRSTQSFSQILKTVGNGHAQHYGLLMAAGILALLVLVLFVS